MQSSHIICYTSVSLSTYRCSHLILYATSVSLSTYRYSHLVLYGTSVSISTYRHSHLILYATSVSLFYLHIDTVSHLILLKVHCFLLDCTRSHKYRRT